ncbi:MAG TPA: MFS transporter [Actinomycetales bacterium]|jgi:fucose permease
MTAPDARTGEAGTAATMRARTAVFLVFATNGMVLASLVSRVPAISDALALKPSRLGLVLLAMSVGAVLALPTAGLVIRRLGTPLTIRLAATICTLGLALAGLAQSVPLLVGGLFLIGLGSGNWDVAMNVEGAEVERRLRRTIMPRFHAAFSLGTVAGALLGVLLNAVELATAAHLVGVAVVVLAVTLWASRTFLADVPLAEGEVAAEPTSALAAWREPRTILVGFMVLAFAITEGSANDWLALAVREGYGVSNAGGVLAFAVFVSAMTVGRLAGTPLLDRYGRVLVLRATVVLAVAGLTLVIVGSTLAVALVGTVLWGFGASLGFPVGMSAGADDPAHAATRVSVVSSIGYTAFLAGPPLIGFLADHVGYQDALWVVLAFLATALLTITAAREPSRAQAQAAP